MTIFDINAQLLEALTQVDEATGEWTGAEAYAALQLEREAKLEATALAAKESAAEADAIAAEIKRLQERKRTAENVAKRCKSLLGYALAGEKFKTARVAISYSRRKTTVVDEAAFMPWAAENAALRRKFDPLAPGSRPVGGRSDP